MDKVPTDEVLGHDGSMGGEWNDVNGVEVGSFDRYRSVGLLANPFSASGSDDPHEPATGPWFVDRGLAPPPPPGSGVMVQVIGEQGMGKSTHLAEWRRLQPGPLHYIPRRPYRDRWRPPPIGTLVYGDEIDRLPIPLRRRWFQQLGLVGATLVVGTHRDLSGIARRSGLKVHTHRLRPVSASELMTVLDSRLRAAADVPGRMPSVTFTQHDIDVIHAESRGNLRAADSIAHRILAERVSQEADRV
ncbi:MAG: hypothetical protein OES24_08315 [Acidimicrobiia bacterium]|nr:hypothetical protein [Acidimicrobiia bacterium]